MPSIAPSLSSAPRRIARRIWPRLGLFLALASALTLAASCQSGRDRDRAFQAYMTQVTSWAPVDAETARSIQRIFATQFVDDAAVRQEVAQTVPRIQAHLERVAVANPDTTELKAINEHYRRAYADLLTAMSRIPEALDRSDAAALAGARSALSAWGRAMVDVASDLRRLQPTGDEEPSR